MIGIPPLTRLIVSLLTGKSRNSLPNEHYGNIGILTPLSFATAIARS